MRNERLSQMQDFIDRKGTVTMEEICSEFDIALNTARKDISDLAKSGAVQKIYGGAKSVNANGLSEFLAYERRFIINREQKLSVAKKAASLVEDGDIIFLDSGTTTAGMVDFLSDRHITIFTANVEVLVSAMKYDNLELYFLGGKLNKKSCSTQKVWTIDYLYNFNINKAFMAASGYSIMGGATHASPWEYEIKRFAVEHAMETYLAVDSSKFDKKTLVKYADASEIKNIVTDSEVDQVYEEFFKENGITLHLAENQGDGK